MTPPPVTWTTKDGKDAGRVEVTDGDRTTAWLAPRLSGSSGLAAEPTPIEPRGELPAGTYQLSDGTWMVVRSQRLTRLARTGAIVTVADRRFHLDDPGVKVVGWADPGGLGYVKFYAENGTETGVPGYGTRYPKAGETIVDFDSLVRNVRQVVLHDEGARTALDAFHRRSQGAHERVADPRSPWPASDGALSTHFALDAEGAIYQHLDLIYAAYHAGEANNLTIGIDLTGLSARGSDYGAEPYRALGSLGRLLTTIFLIDPVVLTDAARRKPLPAPLAFHGFLGHAHWESSARDDPGPLFDWARFEASLR